MIPISPPSELTIRRAGSGDAEILAWLGARTFSNTFGHLYAPEDLAAFLAQAHSLARWTATLADPQQAAWLAEGPAGPLGYVLAGPCALPHPEVTPTCGEIKTLYLLAEAQGGGLGGRLFETALSWLGACGPRAIWLGVWEDNLGAQKFYGRRGFTKVGEYGFVVGATVDREHIYRCAPDND